MAITLEASRVHLSYCPAAIRNIEENAQPLVGQKKAFRPTAKDQRPCRASLDPDETSPHALSLGLHQDNLPTFWHNEILVSYDFRNRLQRRWITEKEPEPLDPPALMHRSNSAPRYCHRNPIMKLLSLTMCSLVALLLSAGCMSSETGTVALDLTPDAQDDSFEQLTSAPTDSESMRPAEVPHPMRTNPFQGNQTEAQSQQLTVELKGFVHLDEPKAVLHIGDQVAIVAEETQTGGITLLEINPPEIVYEQSGIKRTLTLASK